MKAIHYSVHRMAAFVHLSYNPTDYQQLLYSRKFSLGANFRDFRGQTYFRENKNRKKMN